MVRKTLAMAIPLGRRPDIFRRQPANTIIAPMVNGAISSRCDAVADKVASTRPGKYLTVHKTYTRKSPASDIFSRNDIRFIFPVMSISVHC